ncbi:MAG: ATP-binding cassette domain-containing protein [Actinomycetota bacterium]
MNRSASTESAIVVADLHKAFGDAVALDGVSFSVPAGSVLGLLGPNGAGKTTTVHCLSTLLAPDSGRATVAGYDIVEDPAGVRASISLTGQFAAVDEVLTGRQNLELFARLLGLSKADAVQRAGTLLERFDLVDAADKRAGTYSGGMRRRLDLAASLVVERPVLFLDEPTTGLDPRSRAEVWEQVRDLRDGGTTVLLTTQYLEEADQLADRIVVIDAGRVIAEGTAAELKDRVGGSVCAVSIADPGRRKLAADALGAAFTDLTEFDGALIVPAPQTRVLSQVVRVLDEIGVEPDDVGLRRPTLDDVFLALTGRTAETAPVGDVLVGDGGSVGAAS